MTSKNINLAQAVDRPVPVALSRFCNSQDWDVRKPHVGCYDEVRRLTKQLDRHARRVHWRTVQSKLKLVFCFSRYTGNRKFAEVCQKVIRIEKGLIEML